MSFLVIPKSAFLIGLPWILIIGIFLATIIYFFYKKNWTFNNTRRGVIIPFNALPGPKIIPYLGNYVLWNVNPDTFTKTFLYDYIKEYGPIFRLMVANHPIVCLSSPELVEPVLNSTKHVNKSLLYLFLKPWIGNSFFFLPDILWKIRRRIVISLPTSKSKTIDGFIDIFNESSTNCVKKMEKVLANQEKGEIDVAHFVNRWALDNACDTIIGRYKVNEEDKALYLKNFIRIGDLTIERGTRPWLFVDKLFEQSAFSRENNDCIKTNRDLLRKFVRVSRAKSRSNKVCPMKNKLGDDLNNLDETFSAAATKPYSFLEDATNAAENGVADCWNQDDTLISDMEGSIFAAYDTVNTAIIWFLYCIAKHPKEQKLIVDELDSVFGDSDRECTLQDVANLKYTECCIREVLRLYPSSPFISRTLSEDMEIGGYHLPAGVSILVNIYGVHRSPAQYSNPEMFTPERFLPENSIDRHRFAFLPFSAGPRNCIGQKYAWLEMKVFVSTILRHFEFSLTSDKDLSEPMLEPSYAIMLKPKDALRLVITKRPKTSETLITP